MHRTVQGTRLAEKITTYFGTSVLTIGLVASVAVAQPDPLLSNPFGTCTNTSNQVCDTLLNDCSAPATCEACGQTRFISFEIPGTGAGTSTAIRVKLTSLHHPSPPPAAGPVPVFDLFEGEYRYLNTLPGTLARCCDPASNPTKCNTSVTCTSDADCVGLGANSKCQKNLCPDSPAFGTFFRCARVGCAPEYRDWSDFSGLITYANGDLIVPSSVYHVAQLADSCAGNEEECAEASPELQIATERWGNLDCSNTNNGVPSASDCGRSVDKVKDQAGAYSKPRIQLKNWVTNPLQLITVEDLARQIDSAKGNNYPFALNCVSRCTQNSQCAPAICSSPATNSQCSSPKPCAVDADCSGLFGTHTCSANGFCTTIKDSCGVCVP